MGEGTRITADMAHGAWIVRVSGKVDATARAQLAFTLSRLLRLGNRDLVVDVRQADGSIDDMVEQTAARAEAAGVGFATIDAGEGGDHAALVRAHAASRLRHRPTALTPDEVRVAA
jgi:GH25 family lysozyme M1 (1,4-beta-N-acetylmuramidase)